MKFNWGRVSQDSDVEHCPLTNHMEKCKKNSDFVMLHKYNICEFLFGSINCMVYLFGVFKPGCFCHYQSTKSCILFQIWLFQLIRTGACCVILASLKKSCWWLATAPLTAADKCAGRGTLWLWTRSGRTQPKNGEQSYRGGLREAGVIIFHLMRR